MGGAATYGPPMNTKNDGDTACACTVKGGADRPLLVTTTCNRARHRVRRSQNIDLRGLM